MSITVTKTWTFDAAHQLPNHDGKCRELHGHTYTMGIELIPAGKPAPVCPGPERVVYRDRIVEKVVPVPGPERVVTVERLVPSPPKVVTRWRTRIKRVVKTRRVVRYRYVCRRPDPSPAPRFTG